MYSVQQSLLIQQMSQSNKFKTKINLSYLFLYYGESVDPKPVYY